MNNKLNLTALVFFATFLFISCGDSEPYQRVTKKLVYFTVDLNLHHNLENLYQHKIFTKKDLINDGEYIETPGVVVINTGDIFDTGVEFAAYDIRCPYEDRMDVTVSINGVEATCPLCKSKYNLELGNRINGPSKSSLQNYCITKSHSANPKLTIRNCN